MARFSSVASETLDPKSFINLRLSGANITAIFFKKTIFSQKTITNRKFRIRETCDEHVHGPFYDCVVCPVTKQIGQNHSGMNGIDRNIFVLM